MLVKCSNCDKSLIEFINGSKGKVLKYQVDCCYCGDHSFVFSANDGAKFSGIGEETEDEYVVYQDEDELITDKSPNFHAKTAIINITRGGNDLWIIKTKIV